MTIHEALTGQVKGAVLRPGDDGYNTERVGMQTWRPRTPDVIVVAADAADVAAAVRVAADHGVPVAVQATGHGVPDAAAGGLLIATRKLSGVRIDPDARTARIEAGVRWGAVVGAAAEHGLAPLNGSTPTVGAVGYTLGGGVGLLARTYGYASDRVRAIEIVTADGTARRVTGGDLFWALRGGGGNFGVVTALEVGLVPVARLYGGGLYFDAAHVPAVLAAWRAWTQTVPEEMTSSLAVVPLPDVPGLPGPLRGRHVAHVRIAYTGSAEDGERLVAPLRAVAPRLVENVREMPYSDSHTIYAEPTFPSAFHGTFRFLDGLDDATGTALLDLAGPGAGTPAVLTFRHVGGALAREPEPSAVGGRDAVHLAGVLSAIPDGADVSAVAPLHDGVRAALEPRATGTSLNFLYGAAATPDQVGAAFTPDAHARLARIKREHDPDGLFRRTHNL
ncbi:FAD-binding oxidoreductase [Actinomadura flavalba]|uniref:FAD-binding oxidoreductase n=1 Tax=Actinomadura flavalba TaxID=1120938 RepID=UPI00036AB6F6|nr:FAD-binding oxidoreductase [Actinomadura flavalba]